jgi:hypothetical protein
MKKINAGGFPSEREKPQGPEMSSHRDTFSWNRSSATTGGVLLEKTPVKIRVIYADTDAMGIVYHTNYIRWFERGRNELFLDHEVYLPDKRMSHGKNIIILFEELRETNGSQNRQKGARGTG